MTGRIRRGSWSQLSARHAPMLFRDIETGIAYDLRKPVTDGREWVSQAIVDDLRKELGFNPPERRYIGQEYDEGPVWMPPLGGSQPMKVRRADGTVVELTPETAGLFPELKDAMKLMSNQQGITAKPPADGLAYSIVNMQAHFGVALSLSRSPMPALMDKAAGLQLFVAGGIYDDLDRLRGWRGDCAPRPARRRRKGPHQMLCRRTHMMMRKSASLRSFLPMCGPSSAT